MKTEEEVQANLKFPKSLKDKLKAAAKENHRSMTAEVVARLEESFRGTSSADILDKVSPEELADFLSLLVKIGERYPHGTQPGSNENPDKPLGGADDASESAPSRDTGS